jgi:hypothetical protein
MDRMSKKVLLVGHCGPDSSFLKLAVKKADPSVRILSADDDGELSKAIADGVDLILFNRELDYGFDQTQGVEMIRMLKQSLPGTAMMLVSNYPESQQAAEQAGALTGFGKREIGSARVTELLQKALG